MKEYIILVAVASVVSALVDILAPKEWRGYIRIVTGFLILAVLISPVSKMKDVEIFAPEQNFQIEEIPTRDLVAEELRKNVEKDIEDRILTEFGKEAKAFVEIDVDEEHKIRGVLRIRVSLGNPPDGLRKRLFEVYGCENVEFGFGKNN